MLVSPSLLSYHRGTIKKMGHPSSSRSWPRAACSSASPSGASVPTALLEATPPPAHTLFTSPPPLSPPNASPLFSKPRRRTDAASLTAAFLAAVALLAAACEPEDISKSQPEHHGRFVNLEIGRHQATLYAALDIDQRCPRELGMYMINSDVWAESDSLSMFWPYVLYFRVPSEVVAGGHYRPVFRSSSTCLSTDSLDAPAGTAKMSTSNMGHDATRQRYYVDTARATDTYIRTWPVPGTDSVGFAARVRFLNEYGREARDSTGYYDLPPEVLVVVDSFHTRINFE